MGGSAGAAGFALGAMSVSWAAASVAAGRVMIHASYRVTAVIGGLALLLGSVVLIGMTPASGVVWAASGALLVGVGMGFSNTTYLVSVQSVVSWKERGSATSANMFMRIVGQTTGAALFGAVLNASLLHHAPEAKDMVEQLMEPAMRRHLGGVEPAQMIEVLAAAMMATFMTAVESTIVATAMPTSLPTSATSTFLAGCSASTC